MSGVGRPKFEISQELVINKIVAEGGSKLMSKLWLSSRLTRPGKGSSREESLAVAMFVSGELCDHAMGAWWPCVLKSCDILFLSNENISHRMKIFKVNAILHRSESSS